MTPADQLFVRLTEVEKIKIRRTTSEDALVGLYHHYRTELSGGHYHGGTEDQGIAEMKEVHARLGEDFAAKSKPDTFACTWGF